MSESVHKHRRSAPETVRVAVLTISDTRTRETDTGGDTADIKNSGGRRGGALTAGAFLKEFADYPWAHLDVAGTAYGKKGNAYTPKGATGIPARLLVEFLLGRVP